MASKPSRKAKPETTPETKPEQTTPDVRVAPDVAPQEVAEAPTPKSERTVADECFGFKRMTF